MATMKRKISIIGMGYVGCGNALALAQHSQVSIVDIDTKKVNDFNVGKLPISDTYAQNFLDQQELDISSTIDLNESIKGSSFVILALPTNFDEGSSKITWGLSNCNNFPWFMTAILFAKVIAST